MEVLEILIGAGDMFGMAGANDLGLTGQARANYRILSACFMLGLALLFLSGFGMMGIRFFYEKPSESAATVGPTSVETVTALVEIPVDHTLTVNIEPTTIQAKNVDVVAYEARNNKGALQYAYYFVKNDLRWQYGSAEELFLDDKRSVSRTLPVEAIKENLFDLPRVRQALTTSKLVVFFGQSSHSPGDGGGDQNWNDTTLDRHLNLASD